MFINTGTTKIHWVGKWVLRNQYNYDKKHAPSEGTKTFPLVLYAWHYHCYSYKLKNASFFDPDKTYQEILKNNIVSNLITHLNSFTKDVRDKKIQTREDLTSFKTGAIKILFEEKDSEISDWKSPAFVCYILFFNLHTINFEEKETELKQCYQEVLWSLCFDCKRLLDSDKDKTSYRTFSAAIAGINAISNGIPELKGNNNLEVAAPGISSSPLTATNQQNLCERPTTNLSSQRKTLVDEQIQEEQAEPINFLCTLNFSILKVDQATVEHLDPWSNVAEIINFLARDFFQMSNPCFAYRSITVARTVPLMFENNLYNITEEAKKCLEVLFISTRNFILSSEIENNKKANKPSIEYFHDKPLGNLIADKHVYRNGFFNESNGKLLAELYRDWINLNEFFYVFLRCSQNEKDIGTALEKNGYTAQDARTGLEKYARIAQDTSKALENDATTLDGIKELKQYKITADDASKALKKYAQEDPGQRLENYKNTALDASAALKKYEGTALLEFAKLISKFRRCTSEDGSGETEYYILSEMCDVPDDSNEANNLKKIFKTQEFDLDKENNPDLKKASLGEKDKKVWANMWNIFNRKHPSTLKAHETRLVEPLDRHLESLGLPFEGLGL